MSYAAIQTHENGGDFRPFAFQNLSFFYRSTNCIHVSIHYAQRISG
jgi:hypothetical protein